MSDVQKEHFLHDVIGKIDEIEATFEDYGYSDLEEMSEDDFTSDAESSSHNNLSSLIQLRDLLIRAKEVAQDLLP